MSSVNGLISIARKAGYVIIGLENLKGYDKKMYLLLVDKTAGSSLSREMNFLAKTKNIPLIQVDNLGSLVAIENCKAVGLKNKAISENLIESLKGE